MERYASQLFLATRAFPEPTSAAIGAVAVIPLCSGNSDCFKNLPRTPTVSSVGDLGDPS